MRLRIGINLGDIVVDGDNLMGDGVNVAARLEALAPPGGICVSEAIHTQVRDRLSLDFLDMGEHKVKNIARPVRAYRVPLASEERIKSPFRGLDAFDFEHAELFFGRTRAIASLHRETGAAGRKRQGLPADLRHERLGQIVIAARRAAASDHQTGRGAGDSTVAALRDPPLGGAGCNRIVGSRIAP